jgi:hypothetical protein
VADSFTQNLGLTKPEVGSSSNTWGSKLNADWDTIDGVFTSASTTPVAIVLRDDMKFVNATTTTKTMLLDLSGISTTTPRTLAAPDASGTIAINMPTAMVIPWAGVATTAPTGWLMCDGSAVSRTTFVTLFAAVNTAYGAGDGSTTFNVPDLRGRVPAGVDNMGGSAASRLTSTSMSPNGTTLGATGGIEVNVTGVTLSGSMSGTTSGSFSIPANAQGGGSFTTGENGST